MLSLSPPCLVNFVIYISGEGFILTMHLNYNGVRIYMFFNHETFSVVLSLCVLYYLIVGYTSPWYFTLYLSCE